METFLFTTADPIVPKKPARENERYNQQKRSNRNPVIPTSNPAILFFIYVIMSREGDVIICEKNCFP